MREPDWQSEDGSIRLYRGDCLEVMPELTETVDCICTDLPYNTTSLAWDSLIPFEPLWSEYRRLVTAKAAVVLFGSQPFTSALVMSNPAMFKYCWVWLKSRPGDVFNAKNKPLKTHEDICVFSFGTTANGSDRRMTYHPQNVGPGVAKSVCNYPTRRRAFQGPRPGLKEAYDTHGSNYPRSVLSFSNSNAGSLHPTQKPVALLEFLIRTYTNPGETVLDNTFGSGTTAVACINTGRKFIGIERDENYFNIAVKRCEDALATRQGSLFPNDEPLIAV